MNTNLPTRGYYPALHGLRGVACLLVVFYHNYPFLHKYLFFAWLSVDIFFVLSGYLITDILLNTFGEKNYLKNFYARRSLRIFPLYFTSLILFVLILPRIPNLPVNFSFFVSNQIYFWTFTQNWLLIFKNPNTQFALNHLWSVAVEEQFYLFWPLAVAIIKNPKVLLILLTALFLSFSILRFWLWVNHFGGMPYFNFYTFTRIDGICIGCMVALFQKVNNSLLRKYTSLIVLAFAALNFIFYFLNEKYGNSFPYFGLIGYSTFSMIFGLLVYDIINRNTPIFTRMLDIRFLKFIGLISYGTYIFHWPLYLLLNPYLLNWATHNIGWLPAPFFASTVATLLSYTLGYFSYWYFEIKFLRLKKHFV